MNTGKVLPTFRAILQSTIATKRSAHENPSGSQEQYQKQKEREPSKEEYAEAAEILRAQDSFQKNALKVELQEIDGAIYLSVRDCLGQELKQIRSSEVLRILASRGDKPTAAIGRILDRRI